MSEATGTITILIDGMSCGGCVAAVRRALAGVVGLTVLDVVIGRATVMSVGAGAVAEAVRALDSAGFDARPAPVA